VLVLLLIVLLVLLLVLLVLLLVLLVLLLVYVKGKTLFSSIPSFWKYTYSSSKVH
jgi:hypothetical protein